MSVKWLSTLPDRALLLRSLRTTLDEAGFTEVETPVRIPAPANEPHIIPPPTGKAFLRASPELQMKRLLALGFPKIYQIGPCFRAGERGERHNPEFTMMEWYRADANYLTILGDLKKMVCDAAAAVCGSTEITFQGTLIPLATSWEKIPVREAMRRYAGWDPVENFDADRFDFDLAMKVEPALPRDRPCVLIDYPAQTASLARLKSTDEHVAERWEVYIGGMELCNAFSELTDVGQQRHRFEEAKNEKLACGETPMPLDEEFLADLTKMPSAGGAALGVDRLAMLLLNASSIDEVRAFCPPIGKLW